VVRELKTRGKKLRDGKGFKVGISEVGDLSFWEGTMVGEGNWDATSKYLIGKNHGGDHFYRWSIKEGPQK